MPSLAQSELLRRMYLGTQVPGVGMPFNSPRDAGGGRGFINPPLVNPTAARSLVPQAPAAPALSPLERIMVGSTSPVATVDAPSAAAEEAPQGILAAPQAPAAAPAAVPQGILAQLAAGIEGRGDKGAIYDGMLQAGVGLLSGANLQEGFAKGLGGFDQAYSARVEKDRAAKVPKVVPLADGAFSMMLFPDGTQQIVKNDEVARYFGDVAGAKATADMAKAVAVAQVAQMGQQNREDRKAGEAAGTELRGVTETITKFNQAKQMLGERGTSDQLQGIPGVKSLAEFFGSDAAKRNLFLSGLKVDEALLRTAQTKGAITEKEMSLFLEPIPSLTADKAIWDDYISKRLEVLGRAEKALQGTVQRGETARVDNPMAPAAPGKFSGQVTGLSSRASSYLN